MSYFISELKVIGNEKRIYEYIVFDDLKEYLNWYANHVGRKTFSRVGYQDWKYIVVDNKKYYSLNNYDYEKVTERLWLELLDVAKKTYAIYTYDLPFIQGSSSYTGQCDTKEEAIKSAKKIIEREYISKLKKEIEELQQKIKLLENIDYEKRVKIEHHITHTVEE